MSEPAARAFVERVDMAVFGLVPAFERLSIRLVGVDPEAGARPASALLARAGRGGSLGASNPRVAAWHEAYAAIGLGEDRPTPMEALAAWAGTAAGVPSQGAIRDLAHAFSLLNGIPVSAYDLDRVQGDLWLRPSRGCEHFVGPGDTAATSPDLNELILADSNEEVLARHWHGRQGRPAAGRATRVVLFHLDFLEPIDGEAHRLRGAFVRLAIGFLGGTADERRLTWDTPQAAWPAVG